MQLQSRPSEDWRRDLRSNRRLYLRGGPLTFNPTLIRVFTERMYLSEEEILCPEYPELLFVILQPFGCLPNHVVGREIVKKLREMYPDAQILSMDYDPDVSFANLENRL